MSLLEKFQEKIDEILADDGAREKEVDQYRIGILHWWKAMEETINMYVMSLKNEVMLRRLIREQQKEIEDLKQMLNTFGASNDSKKETSEENKEKKEEGRQEGLD